MPMKKTLLILIFCTGISSLACADEKSDINDINSKVSKIEASKNNLNILELKLHTSELEAAPPEIKYFYKSGTNELVKLQVSVGHETFVSQHSYYYSNELIIKYLKETLNHPDSPPKQAIIYNNTGDILWKNTDEPAYNSKAALDLFKLNMQSLKSFTKY